MKKRPTAPRPWLPTRTMSTRSASAASTIMSPGSPVQTRNDDVEPQLAAALDQRLGLLLAPLAHLVDAGAEPAAGQQQRPRVDDATRRGASLRAARRARRPRPWPTTRPRSGPWRAAASRTSPRAAGRTGTGAMPASCSGRVGTTVIASTGQARSAWTIASTSSFVGTTIRMFTMPNIPSGPSTCGRMWQWNAHSPIRSAVMFDVPALAGADRDRVGVVLGAPGHLVAVARDDASACSRGCATGDT